MARNRTSQNDEVIEMFGVGTEPHLRVIQLKETIKLVPSNSTVEASAQSNQEKLKQLERERDRLRFISYTVGFAGVGALSVFTPSVIVTLPSLDAVLAQLQNVAQRYNFMYRLVKEFGEEVQVEIGLKPENLRPIDFFLRFPDKEYILIQIRSLGNATVTFSEQHQALRFRNRRGVKSGSDSAYELAEQLKLLGQSKQRRNREGVRAWKPDPLKELIEQERWVRRERSDLLGSSSRDKRRPIKKLLVLAGVTHLGDHPAQMYDDNKYLTISTLGTSTIVESDQVIDFIREYLHSRRSRKL